MQIELKIVHINLKNRNIVFRIKIKNDSDVAQKIEVELLSKIDRKKYEIINEEDTKFDICYEYNTGNYDKKYLCLYLGIALKNITENYDKDIEQMINYITEILKEIKIEYNEIKKKQEYIHNKYLNKKIQI